MQLCSYLPTVKKICMCVSLWVAWWMTCPACTWDDDDGQDKKTLTCTAYHALPSPFDLTLPCWLFKDVINRELEEIFRQPGGYEGGIFRRQMVWWNMIGSLARRIAKKGIFNEQFRHPSHNNQISHSYKKPAILYVDSSPPACSEARLAAFVLLG